RRTAPRARPLARAAAPAPSRPFGALDDGAPASRRGGAVNVRTSAARVLRASACAVALLVGCAGCDGPPIEDTNVLVAQELRALRDSLERGAFAASAGGAVHGVA